MLLAQPYILTPSHVTLRSVCSHFLLISLPAVGNFGLAANAAQWLLSAGAAAAAAAGAALADAAALRAALVRCVCVCASVWYRDVHAA